MQGDVKIWTVTYPLIFFSLLISGCNKSVNIADAENHNYSKVEVAKYTMVPGKGFGPIEFSQHGSAVEAVFGPPEQTLVKGARDYLSLGITFITDKEDNVGAIIFGDLNGSPEDKIINSCIFKTDRGIKMGSTREEIIAAYGEPKNPRKMAGKEMMVYHEIGAIFTLKENSLIYMLFSMPGGSG